MTVMSAFESFILSRKLRGLTEKTVKDYEEFVRPFVCYLGLGRDVASIMQEDINAYISILLGKNISRSTLSTYIRHIKIFLRWLSSESDVGYRFDKIVVPKTPKKNVRVYSDEDICCIFEAVYTGTDWITLRNKCIVALMLDSGLRQSEICGLLRSRMYMNDGYMSVTGKGNKERLVPLGRVSVEFLHEYFGACPYDSKWVFVGRNGNVMTANAVKLMVSKVAKRLPFALSSHRLRHNFATNYCLDEYTDKGQIDIYKLMSLLGHEDIDTTRRYLHFSMNLITARENISHIDRIYGKNP